MILETFRFKGQLLPVKHVKTVAEAPGVTSDVYTFLTRNMLRATNRDLAILHFEPGASLPRQRMVQGITTVEGFISGDGILHIVRANGQEETHFFRGRNSGRPIVEVHMDDIMQLRAFKRSPFESFEICYPPYTDGRFQDLS